MQALAYLNGEGEFSDRQRFPFPTSMVLDLKMPGLDGFGVLEHVKAHPLWSIIPIVVLTASADPDDLKKVFRLRAQAFHVKPSTIEARDDLCRNLLDYWAKCETPETNERGEQAETSSKGKLGERIEAP